MNNIDLLFDTLYYGCIHQLIRCSILVKGSGRDFRIHIRVFYISARLSKPCNSIDSSSFRQKRRIGCLTPALSVIANGQHGAIIRESR